jgi:hypothetical protein
MSIKNLSDTIKAMMAAGCSLEQVNAVLDVHVKADEEAQSKKRDKWKNDKRRQRMSTNVHQDDSGHAKTHVDEVDLSPPSSPSNGFPPTPIYKNNTPPSLTPSAPPSIRRSQARGTRLPADWQPRDFLEESYELEKFRDYWASVAGQRGTKLDWDATWRNWVKSSHERRKTIRPKESPFDIANKILKEIEHEQESSSAGNSDNLFRLWSDEDRTRSLPAPSGDGIGGLPRSDIGRTRKS